MEHYCDRRHDFEGACEEGASVCLGVPYFNWGPAYLETITAASDGTLESNFQWNGPDWADINNPDTSAIGFVKGDALSEEASAQLDEFIAELAGGLNLWTGPLNLQDGTAYLADLWSLNLSGSPSWTPLPATGTKRRPGPSVGIRRGAC